MLYIFMLIRFVLLLSCRIIVYMLGANLLESLFVLSFNHQNPQLGLIALTRRLRGRRNSLETGWIGFRSGWTSFWSWRASFENSDVNQGGTFVGSKSGFSKGIHDLEKCSFRWFWRNLNWAHCITYLTYCGSLLIERRFL